MSLVQRLDAIHLRLADIRHEYLGLTNGRRQALEEEIEALYAEKRMILAMPLRHESQVALAKDRALFTEPEEPTPPAPKINSIRAPKRTYHFDGRKRGRI